MKQFEKMTKGEFAVFFLMAICSGLVIGIGGTASLLANNLFGDWGKLIGGLLFSLGIFAIVVYEMRLFTGMVADIPKMGWKNSWRLPVCFLGNTIGVILVGIIAGDCFSGETVSAQAQSLMQTKLNAENWALKALASSTLCGGLITLSVWSVKYAPKKGLSPTMGVMFPIVVFAFCGFDHSVANMLYFYFFGEISWRVVGYILLTVLGNIVGGVILPIVALLRERTQKSE